MKPKTQQVFALVKAKALNQTLPFNDPVLDSLVSSIVKEEFETHYLGKPPKCHMRYTLSLGKTEGVLGHTLEAKGIDSRMVAYIDGGNAYTLYHLKFGKNGLLVSCDACYSNYKGGFQVKFNDRLWRHGDILPSLEEWASNGKN